jgi:hypothetical protein
MNADEALSWPDSSRLGKARHYDAGPAPGARGKPPELLRKSASGAITTVSHPALDTPGQSR